MTQTIRNGVKTTNCLSLSDGHQLCYAEYGEPEGIPVFLFHGDPGSRLGWGLMPHSPFLPKLRIIAPDRPGYGKTDFKKQALEKWPQDMAELADHLGIRKFIVFGVSGGGPYALACAWKIPDRLLSAGIFASVGPNTPEAVRGLLPPLRLFYHIANPLYGLIKLQLRIVAWLIKKNPALVQAGLKIAKLSKADQKILAIPEVKDVIKHDFPEAYRQNGRGSAYDSATLAKWPIPLDQIMMKVEVWQAKPDPVTGNMSGYIARQLPNAKLHIVQDAGHLWFLDHMPELLEILITSADTDLNI